MLKYNIDLYSFTGNICNMKLESNTLIFNAYSAQRKPTAATSLYSKSIQTNARLIGLLFQRAKNEIRAESVSLIVMKC